MAGVAGIVIGAAGGYLGGSSATGGAKTVIQTTTVGGGGASTVTQTVTATQTNTATTTASASAPSGMQLGTLPKHPEWKFVFVNHVTTNPFFVPTQYGIKDADALLGTKTQWTGSTNSLVSEMVDAFNAAVAAKVDGIATTLIDLQAFNKPVNDALAAGIPVIGYNADARKGNGPVLNNRLSYVGQSLYNSGRSLGTKIMSVISDKSARIALFIATPGTLNIQPRIDGASDVLKENGYTSVDVVGTDPLVDKEGPLIDAYYLGHTDVKGMFAVDAGDTLQVGNIAAKEGLQGKVFTGGFDLLPGTLQNIKSGVTQFTIDQQPYLQGYYPVVEMYLYKLSSVLMHPADTDTSLQFVGPDNVDKFLGKSRFEGSTDAEPTF